MAGNVNAQCVRNLPTFANLCQPLPTFQTVNYYHSKQFGDMQCTNSFYYRFNFLTAPCWQSWQPGGKLRNVL